MISIFHGSEDERQEQASIYLDQRKNRIKHQLLATQPRFILHVEKMKYFNFSIRLKYIHLLEIKELLILIALSNYALLLLLVPGAK